MKRTKVISVLLIMGMTVGMLAGCGKSSDSKKDSSEDANVTTYTVGTEGAYPPFNYVNDSGEPDGYDVAVMKAIVCKKGNKEITSDVDSIAGKTIAMATSGAQTSWLEKYNEEHPDKAANILYTDGDMSKTLQKIINGRADAHIASIKVTAEYVIKEQGLQDELEVKDFTTYESLGTYTILR